MRAALLGGAVVLAIAALFLFSKYTRVDIDSGFGYLVGSIACLVLAMVCGGAWFLTKPKESMEDISITKI
ncbi:MAG: hypothetical protein HY819_19010 [Acidobacteria bacterium]|nr:hypothetical protein [Acidobacteriota bacterium]